MAAIHALGEIADPEAIPAISRLVTSDPHPSVRELAARCFIDTIIEQGTPAILLDLPGHADLLVRTDAAIILGGLAAEARQNDIARDRTIVPAVIASLDDPHESVVLYATQALYRIATPDALAAVKQRNLPEPFWLI